MANETVSRLDRTSPVAAGAGRSRGQTARPAPANLPNNRRYQIA